MASVNPIESFWYSRSKVLWLFWPINLLFLLLVVAKRFLYQTGVLKINRFKKPVVVVGNISVGGTGKTPFINQLVRLLAKKGIKAGIVSRGYLCKVDRFPHQVVECNRTNEVGDEAFMQFADLNRRSNLNIPIVIDPDRSRAVRFMIENNQVDIVISDDGMQHYQMGRVLEIVLFDAERRFGNQFILPLGPLREPLWRIRQADFVVQNGHSYNDYSEYRSTLKVTSFVHILSGEKLSTSNFSGKKVNAIAGIGHPDRFFKSLEAVSLITRRKVLPDHYDFTKADFDDFGNETVIMTEKDSVKCLSFALENWYYLKVEMQFEENLRHELVSEISKLL